MILRDSPELTIFVVYRQEDVDVTRKSTVEWKQREGGERSGGGDYHLHAVVADDFGVEVELDGERPSVFGKLGGCGELLNEDCSWIEIEVALLVPHPLW